MPTLETGVLWVHILAGTIAVFAGSVALVTTKGGLRHRRAGRVFLGSMLVTVGTVFVLLAVTVTRFRIILTLVAIFSGYLAFSGYRILARKRPMGEVGLHDWGAAVGVILACLALSGWGIAWLLDGTTFGLVMVVFGAIGIGFGTLDVWSFREADTDAWIVSHLQRMIGAFIATVSAVSAVNLTGAFGVVAWLWPTAVGVPLIVYWSRAYT
jgi:hypothetical protein